MPTTIQTVQNIELPNGIKVRAGSVLTVPDPVAAALIKRGVARPREKVGPREYKGGDDAAPTLNPGDPLPDPVPYVRVATDPMPAAQYEPGAYEDQDNFVRNLVTITAPFGWWDWWSDDSTATPAPPVTPSPSAGDRPPVLDLATIKLHCHVEMDQTEEDDLLTMYEMAARLRTETYLRYQIDDTVGENIKVAMLMLIAHWYRNREAVSTGRTSQGIEMPLAFTDLLSLERDYPTYT
jgi:hypothetical protein